MAVVDEIAVVLQGQNPEGTRRRAWSVVAGRDLFGNWVARVSFGRIGCRGRTIPHEFASDEEARSFVRAGLRRRRGAARRCGVDYRVIEASPAAEPLLEVVGLSRGEDRRNSQVSP